jgi:hypothetical protein
MLIQVAALLLLIVQDCEPFIVYGNPVAARTKFAVLSSNPTNYSKKELSILGSHKESTRALITNLLSKKGQNLTL